VPPGTDDIDIREAPSGVPHLERPLCEPVELRPGARARIERVRQDARAGPSAPFLHFHDVHELVVFGSVAGHMYAHGRGWRLRPGSVAFIPSMRPHDFALEAGAHDWVLVQIDAASGDALARRPGLAVLGDAFCALPDGAQRARIDMLAGWALRLPADAPQLPALLETLLYAVAEAPRIEGERQRQRDHPSRQAAEEIAAQAPERLTQISHARLPVWRRRPRRILLCVVSPIRRQTGKMWEKTLPRKRSGGACTRKLPVA